MLHRIGFGAVSVAFLISATPTAASDMPSHDKFQTAIGSLGISETIDWSVKPVRIVVVLNQADVISHIPGMQQMGLLNPDLTQTFVNMHPNEIVTVVGTDVAALETIDAYRNSKIDAAVVRVELAVADDYGHLQTHPVFSYGFDRALFERIDWDHFDPANLLKVGKHFRYSEWAQENLELQ